MDVERALAKAAPTPAADQQIDYEGRWYNQLESWMDLTLSGPKLSGKYFSAVGGPNDEGVEGELRGYVSGDLISWVVRWPAASITAWTGQVVSRNGTNVIEALWQMSANIPDEKEPRGMWQAVMAGIDHFHRH